LKKPEGSMLIGIEEVGNSLRFEQLVAAWSPAVDRRRGLNPG
jgi:hypothetical protein